MTEEIGAQHEFHDQAYAAGWAGRFKPTPERLALFNLILSQLQVHIPKDGCVVELGIGPGYLAHHLLSEMPQIQYFGVDYSGPMIEIARERLGMYSDRISFVQADLVLDRWGERIPAPVNAVVSTWALHDLGGQDKVEAVYQASAQLLEEGGILLNGDFIKPDNTVHAFEPGRFEIARHLEMLRRVGFNNAACLQVLEEEIESPTPAQNYACFMAEK